MSHIKHAFASGKADGTDATLVKPSNWNADHDMTTDADGVVLGRLAGAGAGPIQELPFGAVLPYGTVLPFAGATSPTGWLICDGSSLLRSSYPDLFAALGTAYGAVDGAHFSIPDLRGRTIAGLDSTGTRLPGFTTLGTAVGAAGGQLQAHVHAGVDHLHAMQDHRHRGEGNQSIAMANYGSLWGYLSSPSGNHVGIASFTGYMEAAGNTGGADRALTTGNAGDNSGVNNVQPTLGMNYIIKT